MAETVVGLIERVLEEGGFDAPNSRALEWLTVRQRQMCARSRCYRKTISLGVTVNGQSDYALPAEVLELREVLVGGTLFGPMRHTDPAQGAKGWLWLGGEGGIAGRDDNSAGEPMLRLYPTPAPNTPQVEPGAEITIYAVCRPPDLAEYNDATLKVPTEYVDALVSGAIATGMLRMEARPDLAQAHETIFAAACGELLQATNRRFRGSGPAQIRVAGINA